MIIKNVNIVYASLHQHAEYEGVSTGKYEATFLIPKTDTATYTKIHTAIKKIKNEKLPGVPLQPNYFCLRDGDESDNDLFKNHWTLKASNRLEPALVDMYKNEITDPVNIRNKFRTGSVVNANISFWVQDNKYGKRINSNLLAIQLVKTSPRLNRLVNTQSLIDAFDEEDWDEVPF